jgi:hypothetical protein
MLSAPYALGSMAIWTELKQREQLDLRKRVDEVADVLFRRSCFRECHPGCASQDVTTKTFFECFNGSHCKMKHHNSGDSASRSDNPLPDAASRLSSSHVLPPTVSGVLNGVPDVPETVVRPLGAIILKTNQHLGGCVQLGEQAGTATGSAEAASVTSVTGGMGGSASGGSKRGSGRRGQRGAGKRLLSSTGPMADTQCPRLAGDSSAAASGLDSSSDPTGHLAPRGGRGRA